MEGGKLSRASRAVRASPIQELSLLAQRRGAINLAEGFPDFPAPPLLKRAAAAAVLADLNQYTHVQGICDLLAESMKRNHGLDLNPVTDFVICCGQTEAFAASIFAGVEIPTRRVVNVSQRIVTVIDQGDEVLLFDPAYETYEACIALAGGVPVYVELDPPHWTLNVDRFMKSFTSRTKAVVVNSPHNPTGKVFSMEELKVIAEACCNKDCIAITDEVYEYITFDMQRHTSLASFPGMQERTIITSSLSKTFSVTGWRIGWACAPASIASAIRNIHIKITDSAPAPFQEAALTALRTPPDYFKSLKAEYEERRDCVVEMLSKIGFQIHFKPQGSVFVFAELPENWHLSDIDFVKNLIEKAGVAAVPGRGFFHGDPDGPSYQSRFVRFAFCKSMETLKAASEKMRELVGNNGLLQPSD
ncbi:Kynurenine--oxoglutarate transaminase [Ananas comosus]|uniref:Kynurenine--oxoglutarate transaminase n=1 Tax=Ananas comosus TaxID=4615 RepID=A0A199W3U0_ANACO|nr:Kynurenine--oxoglutarate transaminase [Ananas comosus]